MYTKNLLSVLLIAFGTAMLSYSGISFASPGDPIDFLGMIIQTTDRRFIPLVMGALTFVVGITLLFSNVTWISWIESNLELK